MTFKSFVKLSAFAALITSLPAQDQLKIGTVKMQDLFKDYHRTIEIQSQINTEASRVKKDSDERKAKIQEIFKSLEALKKQIDDPAVNDTKKKELVKDFQTQQQEGITLEKELQEFLQRRDQAIREKMNQQMKGITEEIGKIIQEYAKSESFDYVLDQSALSLTQTPFLIYSKDAVDVTPFILKDLNKDAPAKTEESSEKK